jgi:hypothetical protein
VAVESSESALEYGDIAVDENSMVNADLHFDSKLMHLYVMTEKKVSKVKVQECNVYKSCWDCLNAKDPYCGWCSLENKYGNQFSYYYIIYCVHSSAHRSIKMLRGHSRVQRAKNLKH